MRDNSGFFKKSNRKYDFVKRCLALVVCAATLICGLSIPIRPIEAEAAPKTAGVKVDNGYLLKLTLGSVTTDQILYFCVKYYDENRILRSHFIYPTDETLRAGFGTVAGKIKNTTADKKLPYLNTLEATSKKMVDNPLIRIYRYAGLGALFAPYSEMKALQPMGTDYYYFEPDFTVSEIVGVKFFAQYKADGVNEISLQDVSLYRVDYLYDIDMYDTLSDRYFIDFEGKSLMQSRIERTFSWTSSDTVFDFGTMKYEDGKPVDTGREFYSATYFDGDVKTARADYRTAEQSKRFTFRMSIADVYGAGAEYMNSRVYSDGRRDELLDGWLRECLALEVQYQDRNGCIHFAKVPVVLSSMYKALSEGGDVTKKSLLSGYFQQGETIVFDAVFPDAEQVDLSSCRFVYGRESVKKELNYTYADTLNGRVTLNFLKPSVSFSETPYGKLKETADDRLILDSMIIYDTDACAYSANVRNGFLDASVTGTPLYYFLAPLTGFEVPEETEFVLQMAKYMGTENLNRTEDMSGKFMITLKTDTPANSSTTAGINMKLHYRDFAGEEKETRLIVVRNEVEQFMGYWPCIKASDKADVPYAYVQGTQEGGKLSFLVDIPDVDKFLGAYFSLSGDSGDDWQLSAIGIHEVKSMGKRKAEWIPVGNEGTYYSDRTLSREYSAVNISPTIPGSFLVEPGKEIYVSFTSGGSRYEDNDVDLKEYKYRMNYEEALQNLGFTKSRETYVVDVAVAGDIVNGMINEDCGSKNQFYFKLVFEDGSSGYVLANQQLTSDGFTSGMTHSFKVTTNRDMGRLTAIKILPWNQDEESTVFDKLKIDNIVVTKQGENGLALSWKIEINDWITIDYSDAGAKNSGRGQAGRTENDLAQTYRVASYGYSLNMMFAIETLEFEDEIFNGTISAEIDYVDSNNLLQTKTITDLVALFGEYSGKSGGKTTFKPANNNTPFEGTAINREYMLKDGHTDRFFLSLSDVKSIVRMNLTLKGTTSGVWRIGGISAYRVNTKGTRVINESNEYQYNGDVELIAQSGGDSGYNLRYLANGDPTSFPIVFGDNKIDVDLENTWISSVTYEPQSNDDTINVYAFMSPSAKDIGKYDLKMSAKYALSDETTRETVMTLYSDGKNGLFYGKGIPTAGLRTLRQIGLKVDSFEPTQAPCSYVIVEHIRSGVLIKTYFFNFNNTDIGISNGFFYMNPGKDTIHGTEKQTLMFMVSGDSSYAGILKNVNDLALSFTYTSSCDPEGGTLVSPNRFVSDVNVTSLAAGSIVTMDFSQQYVKDIQEITFIGQGSVSNTIKIGAARIATETVAADKTVTTENIYSFGKEMSEFITYSPRKMALTGSTSKTSGIVPGSSKTVGALAVKIATASGTSGLPSNARLRMKIGYADDYGQSKETVIPDVSSYLVSGSLNPGDVAELNVLVNGISALRFLEFEPVIPGGGTAAWTVGLVSATLSVNSEGVTEERLVNKTVVTGAPETIGFGDVKIQVVAYITKDETGTQERRGFSSASDISEGILMYEGNEILLNPAIDGSIAGLLAKCQTIAMTAGGNTVTDDVTEDMLVVEYDGDTMTSIRFVPTVLGDYRITVSSQEIPSVKVEINVSVLETPVKRQTDAKEQPKPDTPAPEENPENI